MYKYLDVYLQSAKQHALDDHWDEDDHEDLRSPSRQDDLGDLDDYGYTDDQRQALRELDNMRLDLGYVGQ